MHYYKFSTIEYIPSSSSSVVMSQKKEAPPLNFIQHDHSHLHSFTTCTNTNTITNSNTFNNTCTTTHNTMIVNRQKQRGRPSKKSNEMIVVMKTESFRPPQSTFKLLPYESHFTLNDCITYNNTNNNSRTNPSNGLPSTLSLCSLPNETCKIVEKRKKRKLSVTSIESSSASSLSSLSLSGCSLTDEAYNQQHNQHAKAFKTIQNKKKKTVHFNVDDSEITIQPMMNNTTSTHINTTTLDMFNHINTTMNNTQCCHDSLIVNQNERLTCQVAKLNDICSEYQQNNSGFSKKTQLDTEDSFNKPRKITRTSISIRELLN